MLGILRWPLGVAAAQTSSSPSGHFPGGQPCYSELSLLVGWQMQGFLVWFQLLQPLRTSGHHGICYDHLSKSIMVHTQQQ